MIVRSAQFLTASLIWVIRFAGDVCVWLSELCVWMYLAFAFSCVFLLFLFGSWGH